MFEEEKNKQSSTNNNKGAGLNKPKGEKEASNKNSENQSNSNAYSPSQDNDLQKEIEKAQNIFNKQSKKDKPSSQESSPEKVDKNPEIDKKEPKQEIPSRESSDLRSNKNEPAVEVPEMAKKDIIEKARDAGADNKERVYTMPGKYKDKKPKVSNQGGNKKTLVLVALIIFILAGVGAGYFLWFKPNYQASINQQPPAANEEGDEKDEDEQEQEKEPEEGEEEEGEDKDSQETELSQAKTLDKTVQDNEDKEISTATFDFPKGALPLETQIELSGKYVNDEIRNSEKYSNTSYKIIGALYELSNADIILKKTITLKMGYSESLIQESWEDDLKLAYFKDGMWTPLPGRLDTNKNMIEVEVGVLPSDTFAIVVNKDYISSGPEEFSVVPDIVSSTDSDNDGLTDVEEELFATEKNNPDSDGDQNPDGQEVITLKDPTSDESGAKLTTTGLLDVYTNPTFSYSFFYPADWLAKSLPNTNDEEVLVITNTGEFFTITVEDNPELLSPDKWYLNQSSLSDDSELYSTTVNNQPAIWNPNRSTVYIARDNKIYALSYKIGTEAKANFKSTFEMIIKGFQFVTQPQGRPNGTLIKYPDEPGVYLVENGKKRPFKSGEVFTNLGFKWEDVIEIPISEEYPTGEIITGRLDGTLIKYPDEPGVYLVENGKKRPFKSGEVFTNLGFKWEDVIEIPSDENYPTGAVIDSHVTSTPITP